jgi:cytochrome c553
MVLFGGRRVTQQVCGLGCADEVAILVRLRIATALQPRPMGHFPRLSTADKPMIRSLLLASCLILVAGEVLAQAPAPSTSTAAPATASTAPAAAPAPAPLTGDPARGKELTYTCQGCHGVTGYRNAYPNYHVPRIGGQAPQYIINALTEYKQGTRMHPTMQVQARSFSAQDIADIAAYISSLK